MLHRNPDSSECSHWIIMFSMTGRKKPAGFLQQSWIYRPTVNIFQALTCDDVALGIPVFENPPHSCERSSHCRWNVCVYRAVKARGEKQNTRWFTHVSPVDSSWVWGAGLKVFALFTFKLFISLAEVSGPVLRRASERSILGLLSYCLLFKSMQWCMRRSCSLWLCSPLF